MKRTHIVAAIIFNQDKSQVFITKRAAHVHKGGYWEFPGGKVEAGETAQQAIARELYEEVGIEVRAQTPFEHFDYDYPDKSLVFDFILVTGFSNQPYGKEGQLGQWVSVNELAQYEFPQANIPVLERVIKEFA